MSRLRWDQEEIRQRARRHGSERVESERDASEMSEMSWPEFDVSPTPEQMPLWLERNKSQAKLRSAQRQSSIKNECDALRKFLHDNEEDTKIFISRRNRLSRLIAEKEMDREKATKHLENLLAELAQLEAESP